MTTATLRAYEFLRILENTNYDMAGIFRKHMIDLNINQKIKCFTWMRKMDMYFDVEDSYGFRYAVMICKLLNISTDDIMELIEFEHPDLVEEIKSKYLINN